MKTLCITSLKVTALVIIMASSFLALTAQYGDNQWNPIREFQQLKNQHRRDDAIDLVNFLKETQTHGSNDLRKIEKEIEYGPFERAKSFVWDGAIKGKVNDTFSGIGALAADFCLYGDIRDITVQTFNLLFDQEDFNGVVGVLSGAGIAFSTMPLFDGLYAMNKNTAKFVRRLPARMNQGMLRSFLSGRTSPEQSSTIYDLLKKNGWSIPRTTSILSNIHNPANLKHAADLISLHKQTGNVFINTAGNAGLSLYSAAPKALKQHFIDAFKRHPKAILGISKSHLIVHSIKALNKYDLVSLLIPVAGLSVLLSMLHPYLLWVVFFGSIVWLASTVNNLLKLNRIERKTCP